MASKETKDEDKSSLSSGQAADDTITVLLGEREKRGLPLNTNSESCFLGSPLTSDLSLVATSSSYLSATDTFASSDGSIGSPGYTQVESQSSGYTTESSFQTARAASGLSFSPWHRELREIHVSVEANATDDHIQEVHSNMRNLLNNELALIHETSGGSRRAIYLIAYQFM